jgi:hypothetical protein
MTKIKPPCIRNIYKFRKSGCPQKCWDGEEGCTAWLEQVYDTPDGHEPLVVKACMDLLSYDISLKMLRFLEGNQQATESLRNGLCEVNNGKVEPKPDKMLQHMICLMTQSHNSKLINNG